MPTEDEAKTKSGVVQMIEYLPHGASISEKLEAYSMPVTETGCQIWLAATILRYGALKIGGKIQKAHRLSYEMFVGPIPSGLLVCHHCDTPECINPNHLFLGTVKDNSDDMMTKNRHKIAPKIGENHGAAKLSDSQVYEIKKILSRGESTQGDIARMFDVNHRTISGIKTGKYWRHLAGKPE